MHRALLSRSYVPRFHFAWNKWLSVSGPSSARPQPSCSRIVNLRQSPTGRCFSDAPNMISVERPPSEKQLNYAQALSERHGVPIPDDTLTSAFAMSAYLSEVLDAHPQPATSKQLDFARKLAEEQGTEIPPGMENDRRKLSELIETLLNKGGGSGDVGSLVCERPFHCALLLPCADATTTDNTALTVALADAHPTDKQLLFAARLARERGADIPHQTLVTKAGMSKFIEELQAQSDPMAGDGMPMSPTAPLPPPL
jgi:nucleotide-binding universal stress UspA family protein